MITAAIGLTTAGALADRGHPPDIVAERPGLEELAEATADHLTERSTP